LLSQPQENQGRHSVTGAAWLKLAQKQYPGLYEVKTDIWMPLYIGDYVAATQHLSAGESGAYLHLLMHEWSNGPLPDNDALLQRITRLDSAGWETSRPIIMAFFTKHDDSWIQTRLEAERSGARDRRANSQARNESRWGDASSAERGRDLRAKRLSEARAKGTHNASQWEALKRHHECLCVRCGDASELVKDHILPIYRGGSDGIENIQPLCRKCNASKGPDATDYRKAGWENASSDASEMPLDASSSPSPSPLKTNTETSLDSASRAKAIERVYQAYPRKVGRAKAVAEILRAAQSIQSGKDGVKLEEAEAFAFLLGKVTAFAASAAGQAGEFTPHPATWFHQGRYLDDPKEWGRTGDGQKEASNARGQPPAVYVPKTRRETAKLVGVDVAAKLGEMSVEDCERIYGADSARLYRAKLKAEGE
jgi:uncharacterized protein YdaU (DUF1376 family)